MKVLIADFDLFHKTGGGQTVYRRLIETNPAIEFYYLTEEEPSDTQRPSNAYAVPFRKIYKNNDFGEDITKWLDWLKKNKPK